MYGTHFLNIITMKTGVLKYFIFKENAHATLVTKKVNENFLHLGTVQISNYIVIHAFIKFAYCIDQYKSKLIV